MGSNLTYSDNLNTALEAPDIDPQYLMIANDSLAGKSIPELATLYNLSPDKVTAIVEKPEVKRYIDSVMLSQGYLHRTKRMALINRIIDAKVEEAIETDIWSKKDLLEWLKLVNDMDKDFRPQAPKTAVQVNQTNNYASLMQDLLGGEE